MEVASSALPYELWLAYVLVLAAVMTFVYCSIDMVLPGITQRLASDQAEINAKLQDMFHTESEARTFLLIKYVGAFVALLVGLFLLNSLVFGMFLAVAMYFIPTVMLNNIVRRRRERLEEQTADVMTAMSACIKSGMTIEQAFDEIIDTMYPPISQEFALIRERLEAGQPIVAAVRSANNRLNIPRLSLIFQTIIVSQERGGRLASLMDRLADSTREIERVEERVKTETSGLRLSARIMFFMPVAICGLLYMVEPDQVTLLFDNFIGNIVLVVAIALDLGAYFIMQKLIDLDV
ncbi:MAG: tight adherence protein B [Halioglobus sp.]|jgi:tight adherence protein B